jgi:hypothetical protein
MTNPTSSGLGQAAGEMLKEMQKAQADGASEAKQKQGGTSPGFAQAMQSQQQQQAGAEQQQQQAQLNQTGQQAGVRTQSVRVQTDQAVGEVKKDDRIRDKLGTTQVGSTEHREESKLTSMLQNLLSGQDKMNKIMNVALSGRQFSPSDLLAMQAGVYRFTQELDLTSKVVEKATGGIKQTLNTQV